MSGKAHDLNVVLTEYRQGKYKEAIEHLSQIIKAEPTNSTYYSILGNIFFANHQLDLAIGAHRKAIEIEPNELIFWKKYIDVLNKVQFSDWNDDLKNDILTALGKDELEYQKLARAGLSILKSHPAIRDIFQKDLFEIKNIEDLTPLVQPLLIELMKKVIINDYDFEQIFIEIRTFTLKSLLKDDFSEENAGKYLPLLVGLANQCYINEYIYDIPDEELFKLDDIKQKISKYKIDSDIKLVAISLIGCYEPISSIESEIIDDYRITSIIKMHIKEPNQERKFTESIESLNKISNKTSLKVQEQYEDHPYPKWVSMTRYHGVTFNMSFKRFFNQFDDSRLLKTDHPETLIAGCGTGRHIIDCDNRYKSNSITAIDLSKSSLSYSIRKCNEYGINNIKFYQADLLELDLLKTTFDVIECGGVLHHLEDPNQGLEVLTRHLKPNGFMKIALYSKLARRNIDLTTNFLAEKGYDKTVESIRKCRKDIIFNKVKEIREIALNDDFYVTSGFKDLLFHVMEHQFSLHEINTMLKAHNLEFIGFDHLLFDTKLDYASQFPDDKTYSNLENWDFYEQLNKDTFANMYQFWVQKV